MFKEVLSSKKQIESRKLIYGVALNDSLYRVHHEINGKVFRCPYYIVWHGMLMRCFSDSFLKDNKTYIGCSVDSEWLTFSVFKKWMKYQDWENKQLDKDILYPNNKNYSPEKCLFVDQRINLLFNYHSNRRGKQPLGVTLDRGKFRAFCNFNGKRKHLGWFDNPSKASRLYLEFKSNYVRTVAYNYVDNSKLYRALLAHSNLILKGQIK